MRFCVSMRTARRFAFGRMAVVVRGAMRLVAPTLVFFFGGVLARVGMLAFVSMLGGVF